MKRIRENTSSIVLSFLAGTRSISYSKASIVRYKLANEDGIISKAN